MTIAMPLLILGAMLALPPSEMPTDPAWATVTKAPAFRWEGIKLEFGNLPDHVAGSNAASFYVRRTATPIGEARVSWADSLTCPELTGVVAGLLAMPGPAAHKGRSSSTESAGKRYKLARPLQRTLFGDAESKLGLWTDQSLQRLEDCWRTMPPESMRRPDLQR